MQQDDLAPEAEAMWRAIDERVAEIEMALVWGNLALARNQLHDLPGSLRLLGLPDLAAAAEELLTAFEADPRDERLPMDATRLKIMLAAARKAGTVLPIATGQAARPRRVLLAVHGPAADPLRGLSGPGWRITVLGSPDAARIWLRMGDAVAVVWHPAGGPFDADWICSLPASLPVFAVGGSPEVPVAATFPTDGEALTAALDALVADH